MKNKKNLPIHLTLIIFFITGILPINIWNNTIYATPPVPGKITDCLELQQINQNPSANYALTKDIDCSETNTWNSDGNGGYLGFEPIDNFSGSLNGNGYTIDHLFINRPNETPVGLFKNTISGASIQNLNLTHENITGGNYIGGVAGHSQNVFNISFVSVSGTFTAPTGIGGLVGFIDDDINFDTNIDHSSADVTVSHAQSGAYIGGIAGIAFSFTGGNIHLTNSRATVHISNSSMEGVGGLIGKADIESGSGLNISASSATGSIENDLQYDGGLIGLFHSEGTGTEHLTITGSHSDIALTTGGTATGGLIGTIESVGDDLDAELSKDYFSGSITSGGGLGMGGLVGTVTGVAGAVTIEKSYNSANISGDDNIGGLVGDAISPLTLTIDNSYSTGDISGTANIGGIMGAGYGTISNVYATGTLQTFGPINMGGLIGYFKGGTLTDSFAAATLTFQNMGSPYVAGIVGRYESADATLTDNYFDAIAAGVTACSYYADPNTFVRTENSNDGECKAVNTSSDPQDPGYAPGYFFNNLTNKPFNDGLSQPDSQKWTDTVWQVHSSTYPTQDIETLAPTLTSPTSSTEYINTSPLTISFTLPELMYAGSLYLTFTPYPNDPAALDYSGAPITITLADAAPMQLNTFTLPTTGGISQVQEVINTTSDSIPPGTYRVTLSYQDEAQNLASSATASQVFINIPHPTLTEVKPIDITTTLANAVYHFTMHCPDGDSCNPVATPPQSNTGPVETLISSLNNNGDNTASIRGIKVGGTYSFTFQIKDTYGNYSNTLTVGPFTVISNGGAEGGGCATYLCGPSTGTVSSSPSPTVNPSPTPKPPVLNPPSLPQFYGYKDVTNNDPDYNAFKHFYQTGVITGNPDGTVQPNALLQRDQVVKILLKGFHLDYKENADHCDKKSPFPDVDLTNWVADYLCFALHNNIVTGYLSGIDKGHFRPERSITWAEFSVLITRNLKDAIPDNNSTSYPNVPVNEWYSGAAKYFLDHQLAVVFIPNKAITRRELIEVLYQLHQQKLMN